MDYANTISGLQRKRDEIAQQIEALKIEAAKLSNDRLAIERSLQAFGVGEVADRPGSTKSRSSWANCAGSLCAT